MTGPTGSGKTTTLYSALSAINTVDSKIITTEGDLGIYTNVDGYAVRRAWLLAHREVETEGIVAAQSRSSLITAKHIEYKADFMSRLQKFFEL